MQACLLYKVLDADGKSTFRNYQWPLPNDDQPGEWVVADGEIGLCGNGPHATADPLRWWRKDARLFVVEVAGEAIYGPDKLVAEKMRLLYEITQQLAQDNTQTINITGWS